MRCYRQPVCESYKSTLAKLLMFTTIVTRTVKKVLETGSMSCHFLKAIIKHAFVAADIPSVISLINE